jgi:outer membrane protein insertion porin family
VLIGLAAAALWGSLSPQGAVAEEPPCADPPEGSRGNPPALGRIELAGPRLDDEETLRDILTEEATSRGRRLPGDGTPKGGGPPRVALDECLIRVLAERLDQLGYRAELTVAPTAAATAAPPRPATLRIQLTPIPTVRHLSVKGNWPMWEEEILRRIRFRPGTRIEFPIDSPELRKLLDDEGAKLADYLHRQGYLFARAHIAAEAAHSPDTIDLTVRLAKGHRFTVGDVVITGNASLPRGKLVPLLQQRNVVFREKFSAEQFQKDLQSVAERYHEEGFPAARVRGDFRVDPAQERVHLRVTVRERKRLEVVFSGNDHASPRDLRKQLTFAQEGSYDDVEAEASARAIEAYYQRDGYFQAEVHVERARVSSVVDRLTFVVQEGPKLPVRSIELVGNRAIPTDELEAVLQTKVLPPIARIGLGAGGYVTTKQLTQDAERIADHYAQRGFQQVRVRADAAPAPEARGLLGATAALAATETVRQRGLHLRYTIEEGPQEQVLSVSITGNRAASTEELQRRLRTLRREGPAIRLGTAYTETAATTDQRSLALIYGQLGRPHIQIQRFVTRAAPRDGIVPVAIEYRILDEGPPTQFGQVVVRGTFKTRDTILRRSIPITNGAPFDPALLELAERNLRETGLFNTVRISTIGLEERRARVHVVVQLEERYDDYGALEVGGGYSTDNRAFASLSYVNRNVAGYDLSFEAKGELGTEIRAGTLRFGIPRVQGTKNNLDLLGFYRQQLTERLGQIETYGLSAILSRRFVRDRRWAAFLRYDIRQVQRREDLLRPSGPDAAIPQVDVGTRVGQLGPGLNFDGRDNPLLPRSGLFAAGSVFFAARFLGGQDDFIKTNLRAQLFLPLGKRVVLAQGVRFDHGYPLGSASVLPKVERFFAGGDVTVRGYEEDRLKVEQRRSNVAPGVTYVRFVPEGTNLRLLHNIELQVTVWDESVLFGLPLAVALFVDTGLLANSFQGLGARDFRHSVGLAFVRMVTPVGAVSLEYGIPLDPASVDDPTGRLHFNWGFVF